MKVIGCLSNNLSRPSFGLTVQFEPGDTKTMESYLPNCRLMRQAMDGINLSPQAEYTPPSNVYLKYEGKRIVPRNIWRGRFWQATFDKWSVEAGKIEPEKFEIPRKANLEIVGNALSKAVSAFCRKVCKDPLADMAKHLKSTIAV